MFVQLYTKAMEGNLRKNRLKLEHPVDFLKYVDSDFINSVIGNNPFKTKESMSLYCNISQRNLMKRALIISRPFVEGLEELGSIKTRFQQLVSDCLSMNEKLRQKISKEATKMIKKHINKNPTIKPSDIIIDMPKAPTMEESLGTTVPIDSSMLGEEREIEIDEIFPIKRWAEGYNAIKWRGHVFCYKESQQCVNMAARKVFLGEPYNIFFSKSATVLCNIKYRVLEEETQKKLRT